MAYCGYSPTSALGLGCSSSRMPSGIAGAGAGCGTQPTIEGRLVLTGYLVATQPPKEGKAVRSEAQRLCGLRQCGSCGKRSYRP